MNMTHMGHLLLTCSFKDDGLVSMYPISGALDMGGGESQRIRYPNCFLLNFMSPQEMTVLLILQYDSFILFST